MLHSSLSAVLAICKSSPGCFTSPSCLPFYAMYEFRFLQSLEVWPAHFYVGNTRSSSTLNRSLGSKYSSVIKVPLSSLTSYSYLAGVFRHSCLSQKNGSKSDPRSILLCTGFAMQSGQKPCRFNLLWIWGNRKRIFRAGRGGCLCWGLEVRFSCSRDMICTSGHSCDTLFCLLCTWWMIFFGLGEGFYDGWWWEGEIVGEGMGCERRSIYIQSSEAVPSKNQLSLRRTTRIT